MLPLQRTARMPALLVGIFLSQLFLSSCADKIKTDIIAFKALDESLVNSNRVISNQNQNMLTSLENKAADPGTAEKARTWYPKARLIQKLSKDTYEHIEGSKADVKKEAGLKITNGGESFRQSDKNAV